MTTTNWKRIGKGHEINSFRGVEIVKGYDGWYLRTFPGHDRISGPHRTATAARAAH